MENREGVSEAAVAKRIMRTRILVMCRSEAIGSPVLLGALPSEARADFSTDYCQSVQDIVVF